MEYMKTRKIAVPTLNGRLSGHFGGSEFFTIIKVEDNKIVNEDILSTPEHTTGAYPKFLANAGVTDIIVGGVGGKAIDIFKANGIGVYKAQGIKTPAEHAKDLIAETLDTTSSSCKDDGIHPEEDHGPGHETKIDKK